MRFISRIDNTFSRVEPLVDLYGSKFNFFRSYQMVCIGQPSPTEFLPKLDNEKQNLCEGPITAEECLAALKTFQQ